ncbi:MAG: hypothetical protein KY468_11415 [Armatimonadetes bacterium]|nr:hypothetical protein [Armatimonadota bacterium]
MTPRPFVLALIAGGLIAATARAQEPPQTIPLETNEQYAGGRALNIAVSGTGAASALTLSPLAGLSAWNSQLNALPEGGVFGHALLSSGNKTYQVGGRSVRRLYLIGGQRGETTFLPDVLTATVDVENGTISAFTASTNPLPQPRAYHTAVLYNNTIYVVGGDISTTGQIADLQVTDTVLMSVLDRETGLPGPWQQATKLPEPRDQMTVVAAKGTLYAVAGALPGDQLIGSSNTWSAQIQGDGTLGEWVIAEPPTEAQFPPRYGAGGFALGDALYVAGGVNYDASFARDVSLSDVRRATLGPGGIPSIWTETPNLLPIAIGNIHNSTVPALGNVYLIGGYRNGAPSNSVVAGAVNAQGNIEGWTQLNTTLPLTANLTASTQVGNTLVTAGGRSLDGVIRDLFVGALTPVTPAAFAPYGVFESAILDFGVPYDLNSLSFTITPTDPAEAGTARIQIRTAPGNGVFGDWTELTSTSPITINKAGQYLQYRVVFSTTDPTKAAHVSALTLSRGGIALLYGDVSLDGKRDILDAILALRAATGILVLKPAQIQAGDVAPKPGTMGRPFGDGQVNVADAVRILRTIVGLDTLP